MLLVILNVSVLKSYFNTSFKSNKSFETNQKSKYKVDLNFTFISTEKKYFGNILNVFEKIREPIKTL